MGNQQSCGSCWAFSSTGSLEGAYFKATGKLVSLSEEDLVQCDKTDSGCKGGLMGNAFEFVKSHGIASENAYPYTSGGGTTGSCNSAKEGQPVVSITGYTDVPSRDEDALKSAVSQQPVSVAIEADKSAFQFYSGGVLDNSACGTHHGEKKVIFAWCATRTSAAFPNSHLTPQVPRLPHPRLLCKHARRCDGLFGGPTFSAEVCFLL